MVITAKLFGSFQLNRPDYDRRAGIRIELPDGSRAGDLLAPLGLSESQGVLIWVGHQLVPPDHPLQDNLEVKVMQVAMGG